jgi:signal transduction histidine kinase
VANAARHAEVQQVSVFADMSGDGVLVRIRDRGRGFDSAAQAGPEQRGIRDSIIGRMDQLGGRVTISSAVGSGTEVELRVPR